VQLYSRGGRWYAFCFYFDTRTGRRIRVKRSTGIADDGFAAAEKRAAIVGADIERSLALGHGRPGQTHTLTQALVALVQQRIVAGAPRATREITREKAPPLLKHFGPDRAVEEITTDDMAQYAHERARAPATIRRELIELRSAITAVGVDPPRLPKLAPPRARERWLSAAECSQLVAAGAVSRREHLIAYLQLGVRKSELHRIEAGDLRDEHVRVRGTKTEGADRVLPMTAQVRTILERRAKQSPKGPLFESWHNADRDLRAASKAAGLGPISFNDLRRTFATQLAIEGVPILHLMHLLGHRSTRMLESVYARVGQGPHMSMAVAKLAPIMTGTNTGQAQASQPSSSRQVRRSKP
jgi:integrase